MIFEHIQYYCRICSQLNIDTEMRVLMRHHRPHYNLTYSSLSILMLQPQQKVMEASK